MSLRGGDGTKKQAYKNKFAYTHNKNSKLTAVIAREPLDLLCPRCHSQLDWKKKYRKYKMRTVLGRW